MTIVRVTDHLYTIQKSGSCVTVSFLTTRVPWFLFLFSIVGVCSAVIWIGFHLGWNGNTLSCLVGGSISTVMTCCFALAQNVTRYRISIESDVISFQRKLEGIPVGRKKIFSRALVSDLGVYLIEGRKPFGAHQQPGKLCLWVEGKSIEIESFFPISEGLFSSE